MQLEIELTPTGSTIVRQCEDVIEWPEAWGQAFYETGLGLSLFSRLGEDCGDNISVYRPDEANKTGGRWLVVIDTWSSSIQLWAAHAGVALAFLREHSAVLTVSALHGLLELYREDREDADARAEGYENRHDRAQRRRISQRPAKGSAG